MNPQNPSLDLLSLGTSRIFTSSEERLRSATVSFEKGRPEAFILLLNLTSDLIVAFMISPSQLSHRSRVANLSDFDPCLSMNAVYAGLE